MKKHINKQATRVWNITHNKRSGKTYYYHRGVRVSEEFYLKNRPADKVVVTASGKIDQSLLMEAIEELGADDMARSMAIVAQRQANRKRTTVQGLIGMVASRKILTTFANMGLSPEWAADITGSTVDEILDIKNWHPDGRGMPSDAYTNPRTGRTFLAVFEYQGESYFEEITEGADDGPENDTELGIVF